MFCPECGKVYYTKGNTSNQLEPDWEKKSRINNLRKLIAEHMEVCDLNVAPELAIDYIELLSKDLTTDEINSIKNYAKIGCLMKIKEG